MKETIILKRKDEKIPYSIDIMDEFFKKKLQIELTDHNIICQFIDLTLLERHWILDYGDLDKDIFWQNIITKYPEYIHITKLLDIYRKENNITKEIQ